MGKWASFRKSLSRSIKRIALLLTVTVVCLFILVVIYSAVNDDIPSNLTINGFVYFVKNGDVPPLKDYTPPKFDPRLLHGYGGQTLSNVKKPSLLEHLSDITSDLYDNMEYFLSNNPADFGLFIKYLRYQFKEKTVVADSSLINRDKVLRDFYEKTGFVGNINDPNYNPYFLGRNLTFSYLKGSFNLPEPTDTTSFRRNADFLVKNILAMYGGKKAGFIIIKSGVYRESGVSYLEIEPKSSKENSLYYSREFIPYVNKEAVGYYAIYEQKLDRHHPSHVRKSESNCELVIKYKEMSKQYEIHNQLFEVPLSIPKDKISRQKAIKIASSVMLKRSGLPKTALDTLSIKVRKVYSINNLDPYSIAQYRYRIQSVWNIRFNSNRVIMMECSPAEEKINRFLDYYSVDAYSGRVQWEKYFVSDLPPTEED
jgi:hypothetical protein